jgi:hypothetical protein
MVVKLLLSPSVTFTKTTFRLFGRFADVDVGADVKRLSQTEQSFKERGVRFLPLAENQFE